MQEFKLDITTAMDKNKGKIAAKHNGEQNARKDIGATASPHIATVSSLNADPNLCYKLQVLVFDLLNMAKNPDSEKRTLFTTGSIYVSGPYFTAEEAVMIKAATVDLEPSAMEPDEYTYDEAETATGQGESSDEALQISQGPQNVEQAIHTRLSNFTSNRQATLHESSSLSSA